MPNHTSPPAHSYRRRLLLALAILLALGLAVSVVIAGESGDWGASDVQLQNPDSQPHRLLGAFFSPQGTNADVFSDTLPPQSVRFYTPNVPQGFSGTVRVANALPLLGVVTHFGANDTPIGAAQWPLVDDSEAGNAAFVPYFVQRPGGISSRLTVHNLDPLVATTAITFYNPSGAVILTRTVSIPPRGAVDVPGAPAGVPQPFTASVQLNSPQTIFVEAERIGNTGFGSAQGESRGGLHLVAPLFFSQYTDPGSGHVLNSALAMQNIGMVTATAVLTYSNNGGLPIAGQSFAIPPYATAVFSNSQSQAGSVAIVSDQPLVATVLGEGNGGADLFDYAAVILKPALSDTLDRRLAYAPAIFNGLDGWMTRLIIANPSSLPANGLITYTAAPTGEIQVKSYSIPPFGYVTDPGQAPAGAERASATILANHPVAVVAFTSHQATAPDHYMIYEGQYSPHIWHVFLPLIIR